MLSYSFQLVYIAIISRVLVKLYTILLKKEVWNPKTL